MDRSPYEITVEVQPTDIDTLGHVNNVIYLRWVQEAAIAHWNATAPEDAKRSLLWVVVRHEIDYKRAALEQDRIVVRTWVGRARRRTFERHTEILRAADQKILARALTHWCPIDARTGRPTDVDDEVRARFSIPEAEASD